MKTKQNGFTLIELLVVIAIIAILAISITVGYQSVRESARDAKRIEVTRSIATAEQLYEQANSTYTSNIDTLVSEGYLNQDPDNVIKRRGDSSWWVGADSSNFYIRGNLESGKTFCCNQNGCKKVDQYSDCNSNT